MLTVVLSKTVQSKVQMLCTESFLSDGGLHLPSFINEFTLIYEIMTEDNKSIAHLGDRDRISSISLSISNEHLENIAEVSGLVSSNNVRNIKRHRHFDFYD